MRIITVKPIDYHNLIIQVRQGYRRLWVLKVQLAPSDCPTYQTMKNKIGNSHFFFEENRRGCPLLNFIALNFVNGTEPVYKT